MLLELGLPLLTCEERSLSFLVAIVGVGELVKVEEISCWTLGGACTTPRLRL